MRLSSEDFEYVYSRAPRLCVDVVVENTSGILLTLRTLPSWHGLWHIPGGSVLYQEPVETAVKRVAKAELGIDPIIERFLGYIEYTPEDEIKQRGFGYSVSLAFLCHTVGPITLNQDASDFGFFKKLPKQVIAEQKAFLIKHFPYIH